MALTLGQVNTPTRSYVVGDRMEVLSDFTCDASYTTGGYALTPAQLGMTVELDFVNAPQAMITTVVYAFWYNVVTGKLLVTTGAAEVANATDLHLLTSRLTAKGKGTPISSV